MSLEGSLVAGGAALQAGRWEEARAAFEAASREGESPDALLGLSNTLWWLGDAPGSLDVMEQAYALLRRNGDIPRAVTTAMWISVIYKKSLGNQAACSGWLARASRLLEGMETNPLHGWLWWAGSFEATDPNRAVELAGRAAEFAREIGDRDLELCASSELGAALVAVGRAKEGLALVDEAMAGIAGREFAALDTVVATCCAMLVACDRVADVVRVAEWCRVADDFMTTYGSPFLYADCRQRYGSILAATGHWDEAERELNAAIRAAAPESDYHALAISRLAELRLRQGRHEEAAILLEPMTDRACAQPVLAAARHVRGEHAVAAAILTRWLDVQGRNPADAAASLGLLVETHLAMGNPDAAAHVAERLSTLADGHEDDRVAAHAAFAAGRLALSRAQHDEAARLLERAMDAFSACTLPYETARARLALAEALVPASKEVAIAEAQGAFSTFERLGATRDADVAAQALRYLGAAARTGPKNVGVLTKREQEVLRLIAQGLSNPEIAKRLFVSPKTVSHHVGNVLMKLGLRNRTEAAAYASRALAD
ncbi:MAG: LuxR C-terminal-related transcriptional regulator [Actinomycetota bacterium]